MNVVLVSECQKNALKQTRKILDQFAERRGARTWQTPITKAGLDTLRQVLRRSARKNTAVACHWIRGTDHSELLWIVGDASRFSSRGQAPTNSTIRDVLRLADEDDWTHGAVIVLTARLAALMHDLGKACVAFQKRLRGEYQGTRNLYRHEWVSLRLFQCFVRADDDFGWLSRLAGSAGSGDQAWLSGLIRDGIDDAPPPLKELPPLAAAIGWLVLTHHRLPVIPPREPTGRYGGKVSGFQARELLNLPDIINSDWNEPMLPDAEDLRPLYWKFAEQLPVATLQWRKRASKLASRLLEHTRTRNENWLDNPFVMHLSRLSLMLADHHYSSLSAPEQRERGQDNYPLYANTISKNGRTIFNQPLDEHLIGVEKNAASISWSLSGLHRNLPRLARHKGFRKRSKQQRFRWQDKAQDLAAGLRESSREFGFFGVNMASTGYGKTLANGKILYGLASPELGARFSIALGLRTLTLQTGRAYEELLSLGPDELAVRVGGSASRELFEYYEEQAERHGSASAQDLLEEDGQVVFEGAFDQDPLLARLSHDPRIKKLLAAPVLACTIDHLTPATEGWRGGRQIAPMLRLLTSDLVLDEIDDFGLDDLPALVRLVHWAGMLGSRVLLSSATLAPALVEGMFCAYRAGRREWSRNQGDGHPNEEIRCAWFDESDTQNQRCDGRTAYSEAHRAFVERRVARLASAPPRRRAKLIPLQRPVGGNEEKVHREFASFIHEQMISLHERHHCDHPEKGQRISFGLVRMANIEPMIRVARYLISMDAPDDVAIHFCIYHSRYPAVMRSKIEHELDCALDRKNELAVFDVPEVRRALSARLARDHLFVVLGSPVTEVGRDHDYDWAIVEPSSMRSFIQLAGRVRRHRPGAIKQPNILLLSRNLKALKGVQKAVFTRPGFEGSGEWRLRSHDLQELLHAEDYEVLDSRPRIRPRDQPDSRGNLVDLEHARLAREMFAAEAGTDQSSSTRRRARRSGDSAVPRLSAASWYEIERATLTAALPQQQPFRAQSGPKEADYVMMPDESGETWYLAEIKKEKHAPYVSVDKSKLRRWDAGAALGTRVGFWATADYLDSLEALAEDKDLSLEDCAKTFGVVRLPDSVDGWSYCEYTGFSKRN